MVTGKVESLEYRELKSLEERLFLGGMRIKDPDDPLLRMFRRGEGEAFLGSDFE